MSRRAYPKYKPSSIEWLGYVPEHWEIRRLKYMASINDEALSETTDPGYEFSYADIGNVDAVKGIVDRESYLFENAPSRARRIVRDGDTIVSTVRTYLRAIAPIRQPEDHLIVSTGFAVVRPRKIDPDYLSYALRSPCFVETVVSRSTGVSYPAINASEVGTIEITIPAADEQRAIATFLDRETARIDTLIEKKQRQIELLQEKRSALISHAVTKGLDPNVLMKDSGIEWLGQIPEHWDMVPLRYALSPCGDAVKTGPFGSQLLSSEMVGGSIKVYNQRNVLDRDFTSGENYITEDKYQELEAFSVFPGDILVTTRGTIGRCALFPDSAEPGILHPCLMRIQTDLSKVQPEYIALLIQDSGIVRLQLQLLSNATTIDVIYSESLKSVRLPLPPTSEQAEILAWVTREAEKNDRLIAKVQTGISTLQEYRTALISAAVTGKIDVRREVAA
jgi:type I restriction enzyme S subunit